MHFLREWVNIVSYLVTLAEQLMVMCQLAFT